MKIKVYSGDEVEDTQVADSCPREENIVPIRPAELVETNVLLYEGDVVFVPDIGDSIALPTGKGRVSKCVSLLVTHRVVDFSEDGCEVILFVKDLLHDA